MTYGQGQLDMLAWLSGTDPDDDPMAPVCIPVRGLAWAWCLAHNLYSAACACKAWRLGKACQLAVAVRPRNEWFPGCGRGAP